MNYHKNRRQKQRVLKKIQNDKIASDLWLTAFEWESNDLKFPFVVVCLG